MQSVMLNSNSNQSTFLGRKKKSCRSQNEIFKTCSPQSELQVRQDEGRGKRGTGNPSFIIMEVIR